MKEHRKIRFYPSNGAVGVYTWSGVDYNSISHLGNYIAFVSREGKRVEINGSWLVEEDA